MRSRPGEASGGSQPSVAAAAVTRKALVPCPEALFSVRYERGGIRFHSSIRLLAIASGITQNAETEPSLSRSNLVIGYEFKNDTYVLLSDEGLDKVRVMFMLTPPHQLTDNGCAALSRVVIGQRECTSPGTVRRFDRRNPPATCHQRRTLDP